MQNNKSALVLLSGGQGIYKITCKVTGDCYVGSTTNFANRKTHHFSNLRHNRHCNSYLQKAFNKYGESNFVFKVLKYCTNNFIVWEQKYIDNLKPKYNLTTIAGPNFRVGYKMTQSEKRHLSQVKKGLTHTEETKQRLRDANSGKKLSEKTRSKLSLLAKHNWKSKTYRRRISKARKLWAAQNPDKVQKRSSIHKKPVKFVTESSIIIFDSIVQASLETGYSKEAIRQHLKTIVKSKPLFYYAK